MNLRSLLFLVLSFFGLSSWGTPSKLASNPLPPIRQAQAHLVVMKEYFEKVGTDFVLRKEKLCDLATSVSVYDLTSNVKQEYVPVWVELCKVNLNGVSAAVSWNSALLISRLDLLLTGAPKIYRSLQAMIGFGPVGGPFLNLGSNTIFDSDLALGRSFTQKISATSQANENEKLSVVVEVED